MDLCIASINARGLSSVEKFEKMTVLMGKANIICVQETFWSNEIAEKMKTFWDGEILCNNDDAVRRRGVAILIKRGFYESLDILYKDDHGRIFTVIIHFKDLPNREEEKIAFFKELNVLMKGWTGVILLGDFNTVLERIDLDDNMTFKDERGRKELKVLFQNYGLVGVRGIF